MNIAKNLQNSKLKEIYYINEKTHLAIEKKFVLHHSLKINNRRGGCGRFGKKLKN